MMNARFRNFIALALFCVVTSFYSLAALTKRQQNRCNFYNNLQQSANDLEATPALIQKDVVDAIRKAQQDVTTHIPAVDSAIQNIAKLQEEIKKHRQTLIKQDLQKQGLLELNQLHQNTMHALNTIEKTLNTLAAQQEPCQGVLCTFKTRLTDLSTYLNDKANILQKNQQKINGKLTHGATAGIRFIATLIRPKGC